MSENSGNLTVSAEKNILGPDFFGFYTSEAAEVLSQEEGLLPFPSQVSHSGGNFQGTGREKGSIKNSCRTKENNEVISSASLFSNGIGALLSEFKKERLRSLLRESVFTLTPEVDEMMKPVLSICRMRSCLKCKESLLSLDASECKGDQKQHPSKKRKVLPTFPEKKLSDDIVKKLTQSYASSTPQLRLAADGTEIDDDLRFLLENDTAKVEELMKKHSGELSATLNHMEQKLEELLNIIMTTSRPMTITEKQQLRKLIQNLPPRNLDRVVELIGSNKPSQKSSSDEVYVDLDGEDKVTLWRLYFYAKTFQATTRNEG